MSTPVIAYASKSSKDPNDSVGSQLGSIMEGIEREGDRLLYAKPFSESSQSGYSKDRGPELAAAIETAVTAANEHGGAELWVFNSNRLGRGSGRKNEARSVQEVFTFCRRNGVTLRSIQDDAYVQDEAMIGMASKMSHKYSEDLSAFVKNGLRKTFARGEWTGGPTPDGFVALRSVTDTGNRSVRIAQDPDRAPVFRQMMDLALENHGDPTIARKLNAAGHRKPSGCTFKRRDVQNALTNPTYAGAVVWHRGWKDGSQEVNWNAQHAAEAIWTRDEFERVQALRASRDRGRGGRPTGGKNHSTYLLSGLAVCGCGERMRAVTCPYVRVDGTKARRYRCDNHTSNGGTCPAPPIDADVLDRGIREHLDTFLIDAESYLESLNRGHRDGRETKEREVQAAVADLQKFDGRVARLESDYLARLDSDPEKAEALLDMLASQRARRATAGDRVAALEAELASLAAAAPMDEGLDYYNSERLALRNALAALDVREQNERLRATFERMVLTTTPDGVVGVPIYRNQPRYVDIGDPATWLPGEEREPRHYSEPGPGRLELVETGLGSQG